MSSKNRASLVIFVLFVIAAAVILIVQLAGNGFGWLGNLTSSLNREKVEISIIYAPESDSYLPEVIDEFNRQMADGKNPVTGDKLGSEDKQIVVTGQPGSSGTVRTQIVNAINGVQTDQVAKPTIYSPSVGHWLRLVNYETNREVFKVDEARATAKAPVVIAIWESRLNLIKAKNPGQDIGWEELLAVLNSPNGWQDYSSSIDRQKVFYGHTDPAISSTALSTLMSTYYANAQYQNQSENLEQLTVDNVRDEQVRSGVRDIQKLIKHYSSRTTEFKEYIAQGPDYLDFVALEENDLIYINQGQTEQGVPPEKLVALYPKEGTFIHEHPFAIPEAPWVSQEQREAAQLFTDYVLTKPVQEKVLANGFRPVNEEVALTGPFTEDNGVNPNQSSKLLNLPAPEVISRVQQDWSFVKKRSEVILLVDTSGSMEGQKLASAKEALRQFAEQMPKEDSIGLVTFNSETIEDVPLAPLESSSRDILTSINEMQARGSTTLYNSLYLTLEQIESTQDPDVIRAVVLLSDGQDTDKTGQRSLTDVTDKLEELYKSDKPVLVVPIAYGGDADLNALNAIARSSKSKVQAGDTDDIDKLLEVIASYF